MASDSAVERVALAIAEAVGDGLCYKSYGYMKAAQAAIDQLCADHQKGEKCLVCGVTFKTVRRPPIVIDTETA